MIDKDDVDLYRRQKSGIFREKVLEIYAKNPFPGRAGQLFEENLDDGTYELNFDEFEQLLRFWGTEKIAKETSDDGMGLLELVSRYGSPADLHTLSSFCDWYKTDIENIRKWASENDNESIIKSIEI